MARCRTRRKPHPTKGVMVKLFSFLSWRQDKATGEWKWYPQGNLIRLISKEEADNLVAGNQAHFKRPDRGGIRTQKEVLGVVLNQLRRSEKATPSMLTCSETMANAGAHDSDKFCRQTRDKVTIWPLLGDTKAVAVRPRMSEQQMRQAKRILAGR